VILRALEPSGNNTGFDNDPKGDNRQSLQVLPMVPLFPKDKFRNDISTDCVVLGLGALLV
jgi:hypothetical protein